MSKAFMSAYRGFKSGKKVAFNTFLTTSLRNEIKDVLAKWYNDQRVNSGIPIDETDHEEDDEEVGICLPSPDMRDVTETELYRELQATLSPMARQVMECYIEPGEELTKQVLGQGGTRIEQKHVANILHISLDRVQLCRNEIRDTIKTLEEV
jgi:DNA-directed RNA polymerase specialized sigma24 family protein